MENTKHTEVINSNLPTGDDFFKTPEIDSNLPTGDDFLK